MRKLFRQTALDALSFPEQVEQSLIMTPAKPMLIFVGLAIIAVALLIWSLVGFIPYTVDAYGLLVQNPGYTRVVILAPSDGEITEILIGNNERIEVGQVVARLSLDDGVIDVLSQYAGTVNRVNVRRGEEVRANTALMSVRGDLDTPTNSADLPLEAVLYLPYEDVQMVAVGMDAYVVPAGVSTLTFGYITGSVISVAQFPANDQFARALSPTAPLVAVRIGLDEETTGVYQWTLSQQPDIELRSGMQLVGKILLREEHPIERIIRGNAR